MPLVLHPCSEALPGGWWLVGLDTNELSLHSGFDNGSAVAREAQVRPGWVVRSSAHVTTVQGADRDALRRATHHWLLLLAARQDAVLPTSALATLLHCCPMQEYWAAHPKSAAEPQMSSWNGGIAQEQLAWLQRELAAAEAAGERVIVASHNPLTPGAGPDDHLAWWASPLPFLICCSPLVRALPAGTHACVLP